jgi:hypothetical protein
MFFTLSGEVNLVSLGEDESPSILSSSSTSLDDELDSSSISRIAG